MDSKVYKLHNKQFKSIYKNTSIFYRKNRVYKHVFIALIHY